MPDGIYMLGDMEVVVRDGRCHLRRHSSRQRPHA